MTGPDAHRFQLTLGCRWRTSLRCPHWTWPLKGKIERLALKVGENLFNFMQSFCGVDGSKLVVPMDRWFKKFQERARRDPEYLKGFAYE